MKYYSVRENPHFVGRQTYWRRLQEIDAEDAAAVIVIYGRRRVGKTELIEQFFRNRPILKFEGLQPDRTKLRKNDPGEKRRQIEECLVRLDRYSESANLYRRMKLERWSDFFEVLLPYMEKAPVVVYFDELQWLANYGDDFLSEFKPFWDDQLRHNSKLRIIISGSSPSFIVNQFLSTSAMYNRSNHMLRLDPFEPNEIGQFLQKGTRETLLAAIAVGGIPEYLKQLKNAPSVYLGLCERSYRPGEFFRLEKDRIFVSSLSSSRSYEDVLDFLSRHGQATRDGLHKALNRGTSAYAGGSFSEVLQELVEVGFVEKYAPLTAANPLTSHVARYAIADEYLHFYYRFIDGKTAAIDAGKFTGNPTAGVNRQDFNKLMGFSFERWCRKNESLVARQMKFGGVVDYLHGAWFEKTSASAPGMQIDLMYIRKDSKIILCEIKYNSDAPVNRKVIKEVQEKLDRFIANNPRYRRHTLETALITAEPISEKLAADGFFTYLITGEQLLKTAAMM
jgi:AAA+ ATPase superfamily predicted ATPase